MSIVVIPLLQAEECQYTEFDGGKWDAGNPDLWLYRERTVAAAQALLAMVGGGGTAALAFGEGIFPHASYVLPNGELRRCGHFCARCRALPGETGRVFAEADRKDRIAGIHA